MRFEFLGIGLLAYSLAALTSTFTMMKVHEFAICLWMRCRRRKRRCEMRRRKRNEAIRAKIAQFKCEDDAERWFDAQMTETGSCTCKQ